MSHLHDVVFHMVCNEHSEDDAQVLGLVKELASVGVTADQLGAPEDFAVPLPAAVCECEIWGFYIGFIEESGVTGCVAMSLV